jgi:hypothetical protein
MRLLEFNRDEGGANPKQAARLPGKRPAAAALTRKPAQRKAARQPAAPLPPPLFTIKGNPGRNPTRRLPIDIESLQRRIELLERRMQERASREGSSAPIKELEQLKQRMQLLERNLSNELWSARQRESAMLEILARQPLEERIKQRAIRLYTHDLPALGRWLFSFSKQWWEDNHPGWWPMFFQAWQESLDKARGISRP